MHHYHTKRKQCMFSLTHECLFDTCSHGRSLIGNPLADRSLVDSPPMGLPVFLHSKVIHYHFADASVLCVVIELSFTDYKFCNPENLGSRKSQNIVVHITVGSQVTGLDLHQQVFVLNFQLSIHPLCTPHVFVPFP